MGLRDRFFTATTAKAILSWRILLGAGVGVVAGLLGLPVVLAAAAGAGVYSGAVALAMPRRPAPPPIDPFAVGEPWRQIVQGAQRARQRLGAAVASTPAGPLRDRLDDIVARLDAGLAEGWQTARRGDEIDAAIARLDPTALRSRLATLRSRASTAPSADVDAAIASLEAQLAEAERLKELSAGTADQLRLTQARLDELATRATVVAVGRRAGADAFAAEVDALVLELESLHRAVDDVEAAERGTPPPVDPGTSEAT